MENSNKFIYLIYNCIFMDKVVPIRMTDALVREIDSMVEKRLFRNRNEVIREGIRSIIKEYHSDMANRKLIAHIVANYLVLSYKDFIQTIILFGSVAQGTDDIESDIDLLVLTQTKISYNQKLELTDKIVKLLQKLDYVISLQFQTYDEFIEGVKANFDFETSLFHQGKVLAGTVPNSI